jgi:imidazolonepropionase-like amidohydrolase
MGSTVLVLRDFALIDGTGRAPMAGADVVVEDGTIASVGEGSRHPPGATVVEGRGRWLLPGLWDTHIHHVFSGGGFVRAEEFSEEQREWTWRAYLRSGVTSVVSVGDDKDIILAARAAERDGSLRAPRIVAAGGAFTAPGGHPAATILHGHVGQFSGIALEVGDPADARARLRRLVEDDEVDVVKVVYSTIPGGVPRLGRDVLDALVAEAHALERRVFAHVSTPDEAAECLAAGVDGLEHMVLGNGEALEPVFAAAAEGDVVWTATLCLFDKMAHDGDQRYIEDYRPEGTVSRVVLESLRDPEAWWRKAEPGSVSPPWGRTVDLAGRAHEAGVPLALGTDAGNPAVFHGLAVHRELELLVQAGLTPMEALSAATRVAAAKVGADSRLGTVEAGKEADLVVLGRNPLDDIRNTRYVDLVVKRGERYDPADLTVP